MRKGYKTKRYLNRGYLCWLITTPSGKNYEISRYRAKHDVVYEVIYLPHYPKAYFPDDYYYNADDKTICFADSKINAVKAIYKEEKK